MNCIDCPYVNYYCWPCAQGAATQDAPKEKSEAVVQAVKTAVVR